MSEGEVAPPLGQETPSVCREGVGGVGTRLFPKVPSDPVPTGTPLAMPKYPLLVEVGGTDACSPDTCPQSCSGHTSLRATSSASTGGTGQGFASPASGLGGLAGGLRHIWKRSPQPQTPTQRS